MSEEPTVTAEPPVDAPVTGLSRRGLLGLFGAGAGGLIVG